MLKSINYRLFTRVKEFAGSDILLYIIISLAVLQGAWYALSMGLTLFDESQHFNFIVMYSEKISPFITFQEERWDILGESTRNVNYLFYYLMSFPYRFFSLFTDIEYIKVVLLRFLMIGVFVSGLFLFRKVFVLVFNNRIIANLTLLILLLIPGFSPLPGVINYDNFIFLFTALISLISIKIIRKDKIDFFYVGLILVIAFLGSLIKFSFMAIVFPLIIFLFVEKIKNGQVSLNQFKKLALNRRRFNIKFLIIPLLIISILLFIERPVKNVFQYRSIEPSCTEILTSERCIKNYTQRRNINFIESKPENIPPLNPAHFVLGLWVPGMMNTTARAIYSKAPIIFMEISVTMLFIVGSMCILVYFHKLWPNKFMKMFFLILISYVFILIVNNYMGYLSLGKPVGIAGRYLIPVAPYFIFLSLLSVRKYLFNNIKKYFLMYLFITIFVISQGGGILSTMIQSDKSFYWQNEMIINVNEEIKQLLSIIIEESNPLRRI